MMTRKVRTSPRPLRKANHTSQVALSIAAELPRWKIAWAETGRTKLTASEMERIITALVQIARQRVAALESELLKYETH